jgi:hypothetical protein
VCVYPGTMPARLHMKRLAIISAAAIVTLCIQTACRSSPHPALYQTIEHSAVVGPPVPNDVRRLAVWYPVTSEGYVAYGYSRLEQAVFQLKKQRSWIKVVERRNVDLLTNEQLLQLSGRVADESAMRIGQWLGADSVVLFRIEGPKWRDRLLARFHGTMLPIVVSSKIVSVQSGEVLYHDIVTTMPVPSAGEWGDYAIDYELQPVLRSAMDHALSIAIAHLDQSFR